MFNFYFIVLRFLRFAVIKFQPLILSDALWISNLNQNDWFLRVCSVNETDILLTHGCLFGDENISDVVQILQF